MTDIYINDFKVKSTKPGQMTLIHRGRVIEITATWESVEVEAWRTGACHLDQPDEFLLMRSEAEGLKPEKGKTI